jgi:hypothetical protein
MFDNTGGPALELLRFRSDLARIPGFEKALREQVHRLSRFRHPAFAEVRSVQRLEPDDDLALISNSTPGKRLSEVLHQARGPAFASALIRQLAPALALLQQHDAGSAHGILNADRIVVSPDGRLTIVEHVVGPVLDSLDLRIGQLSSMGIALPPAPDGAMPRLDASTDWYQLGLVAMSVLIGRPVTTSELPQLGRLLDQLGDSPGADGTPLSPFIRQWLGRALRITGDRIESGAEGRAALDELLHKEQPRDTRRIETARDEAAAPVATTPPVGTGELLDFTAEPAREVRDEAPVPVTPPVAPAPLAVAQSPTGVPPPVILPAPAAVPPAAKEPAAFAPVPMRGPVPPRPQARVQQGLNISPFERETLEREALAGKKRLLDLESREARSQSPAAAPHAAVARRTAANSLVAALVLMVAAEAGVIAWLTHTLWLAPRPPVIVESTPSGENVVVTSQSIGSAPLVLTVAPDLQWVRVTSPASDTIPGAANARPVAGVIRISSPIALKVFEGSRLLGSVPGADLKLAAGRHEIALVNEPLGYRLQQGIEIGAGETVAIHVTPPPGLVTVDASPWAEVSIDGQAMGRTPLGPLPLAPGEYLFTFRNPAGGSDRQRVTVKSEANVRVVGVLHR